jgi:hypothetical protein
MTIPGSRLELCLRFFIIVNRVWRAENFSCLLRDRNRVALQARHLCES